MNIALTHHKLSEVIEEELLKLDLPDKPSLLYDPVRYTLSLGGKRIRPYFTLISCGLCGGEVNKAVPAALAIELLHNFTLLHDDIMDGAETRRGKPSVFKKWNSSTAILSGDVIFARAFKQLQWYGKSKGFSIKQYVSIIDIFLEGAETVCEGQAFDLEFSQKDVSIKEYLAMIRRKTAALISGAFKLGGAVAGAGEQELNLLNELGEATGTAFQIQDDLLDVIADPSKFGKTPGGDIMEGKKTYLSILALQRGDDQQRRVLNEILSSQNDITPEQVKQVIDIYGDLGIAEQTRQTIEQYYAKADRLLEEFPASDYKKDLIDTILKLKNREF